MARRGATPPAAIDSLLARFHSVLSLAAQLDPAMSPLGGGRGVELSEDSRLAIYQMALASPLGPFDRHRVLCAPSLGRRVELLDELLDDAELLLRAHLDER